MADIEQILGKRINTVKELKDEIKALQDSIVNASEGTDEWEAASVKLNAAQNQLAAVTNAGKKSVDAAKDSIVGMEREYKNLYNTYKTLSEEQRNSDFGKEMANSLSELGEKLNSTKKEVGNFKDNIGNYAGDIMGAFSQMGISLGSFQKPFQTLVGVVQNGSKTMQGSMGAAGSSAAGFGQAMAALKNPATLATGAVGMLNTALTALAANPVALAILAIVVAVKKMKEAMDKAQESIKEAIHNNEELEMSLNESQAYMQAFRDLAANVWDKIAGIVVKVKEFFNGIGEGLATLGAKFLDWTGITDGAEKTLKSYKELAKAQNQLTKAKREYQVLNAKDKAEVERLREEASETEDLNEKLKLLNEAKEKQAEIDQRNLEIAQEELRILEEQAKRTKNGAEMNDKLAAAQANVAEKEAAAAANARQFNKQINTVTKSIKNEATPAVKDLAEEAKKLNEQLIEDGKDELTKLEEKYRKEKQLLEKYGYDTSLLTRKYNKERITIITNAQKQESAERQKMFLATQSNLIAATKDTVKKAEMEVTAATKQKDAFKTLLDAWGLIPTEATKKEAKNAAKELFKVIDEVMGTKMSGDLSFLDDMKPDEILRLLRDNFKEALEKMFPDVADKLPTIFNPTTIKEATDYLNSYFAVLETGLDDAKENRTDTKIKKNIKDIQDEIDAVKNAYTILRVGREKYDKDLRERTADDDFEKNFKRQSDFIMNAAQLEALDLENLYDYYIDLMYKEEKDAQGHTKKVLDLSKYRAEEQTEILTGYFDVVAKLREADWAKEEIMYDLRTEKVREYVDVSVEGLNAVHSIMDSILQVTEAQINALQTENKITEVEAKRRIKALNTYKAVMTGVEVASIAASTASGIMGIWKAFALEKVANAETAAATGPAAVETLAALNAKSRLSAILQTASLAAQGTTQIAAAIAGTIANAKSVNADYNAAVGAASAGAVASPVEIDSTPYSYTRTVQTADEMEALNRPVWVSVQDIGSALNQARVTDLESSF